MTNGRCLLTFIDDSNMALLAPEDAGFSSSEDYLENELHSPTDNSEDSVEVKVSTISLSNKRKFPETFTGPLKKRMCLKVKAEIDESHPFRPWSPKPKAAKPEIKVQEAYKPEFSYFRPPSPVQFYQSEPVSLVKRRENGENVKEEEEEEEEEEDFGEVRVPMHPSEQGLSTSETEKMISITNEIFPSLQGVQSSKKSHQDSQQRREQRNYKNMTRERRIEANARERTRVHTISAAFDTLRRSVPSYSHNQKLSKLSVLRIACSYIMTLSSIVNDEPEGPDELSTSECVDMVSRTIQREGKLRKKKDDND